MARGYRQRGNLSSFILSYLYDIASTLLALKAMVMTKFDKLLQVAFLTSIIVAFFFLPGGHLITIVPKLLGSEGVRAVAGELGVSQVGIDLIQIIAPYQLWRFELVLLGIFYLS